VGKEEIKRREESGRKGEKAIQTVFAYETFSLSVLFPQSRSHTGLTG
jgi:hypothetical protein